MKKTLWIKDTDSFPVDDHILEDLELKASLFEAVERLTKERDDARLWAYFLLKAHPYENVQGFIKAAEVIDSWGEIPDPEGFEGGG